MSKTFADFFAGIGLVTLAFEHQGWVSQYAVDSSEEKEKMYVGHFGSAHHYHRTDIRDVMPENIPTITLAHASFPCTDTSIAGSRAGLAGEGSGLVWEFIRIIDGMGDRKPPILLLENVEGLLTSNHGDDLASLLIAIGNLGYTVDLMRIDAAYFVPQSRVRLFIVAVQRSEPQDILEQEYILNTNSGIRSQKIVTFIRKHPHIRWNLQSLPELPTRVHTLEAIVDPNAVWWESERKMYLYNQMHERDKMKLQRMMKAYVWSYGTVFRRIRERDGRKQSTAELRTDGIAGCLRTPKGGSARQIIVRAGNGTYDARLLNEREVARLMGAETYTLPSSLSSNQVLFGFGDAVCVPVIEWIVQHYIDPVFDELKENLRYQTLEVV